ncbi:hypothetical protein DEJ31_02715 [Curtobacterium sp. MCPF17_031]|nr:hypothetical protein DEJ31_02715 [Curtobacterium sp. MCPF17_031]
MGPGDAAGVDDGRPRRGRPTGAAARRTGAGVADRAVSGVADSRSQRDRDAALDRLRGASAHRSGERDEVLARVAWSTVVEPGDADAGQLVARLGAGRSIRAALAALDSGPAELAELLVGAGAGAGAVAGAGVGTGTDAGARGSVDSVDSVDSVGSAGSAVGACDEDEVRDRLVESTAAALVPAIARWRPRLLRFDVDAVLSAASVIGCALVVPGDPDWPAGVDDLGPHAPLVLWRRGAPCTAGRPSVAVVGSRANTVLGAEAAAEITSAAADVGCVIVSGGAHGIDAVAHRVAMAAGAPTVAVLAGGIDQLYPAANTAMLRAVAEHGALLAECPPGTRPSRWRFLARNL